MPMQTITLLQAARFLTESGLFAVLRGDGSAFRIQDTVSSRHLEPMTGSQVIAFAQEQARSLGTAV